MLLRTTAICVALASLTACNTTTSNYGSYDQTSSEVAGLTIASQMMLIGGATAGLALFPLLIAADLQAANDAMVRSNSRATLSDTYEFVYNRDISTVGSNGNTGTVFRDLRTATRHFRTVLDGHGVARSKDFVLTAVRSADTRGYTLYALVHRPQQTIRIRDARGQIFTLDENDSAYYRPYQSDVNGRVLDVVVDWAGVQRSQIANQKGQAVLLTLAANSVLMNRRSDEFWSIRQKWLSGQYRAVVTERQLEIERRLAQN